MSRFSSPVDKGAAGRARLVMALLAGMLLGGLLLSHAQSPAARAASASSDLATVTYRRVFEGSTPEFVEIVVRQDGVAKADVRQLNETASPQEFMVGAAVSDQIFDLARQLRNFRDTKLDAGRRVAYLGQKTLRWEKGGESYQTQYNYTADPQAAQLQKVFENLAQEQADLDRLEQRLRYDRLGVSEALDRFEEHLNQRELPEPERFLPVLDRIAGDTRLIELARQRARSLAARIRAGQDR
jgi:hypothetical protein